jgi:hypothetical protein
MFGFPWSNFHELNLDWILSVVKEAKEIFVKGEGDIKHAVETADQALETAEQAAAGVIADGAVKIPKINAEVFHLFAYIVSGSLTDQAIPKDALIILRKSTVYNVNDGIYTAAADIQANTILTGADLLQPQTLTDGGGLNYLLDMIGTVRGSVDLVEAGLVIIVDGDEASAAVPANGLAYIKNNTHGLTEGLYYNHTASPFPATGGTADSDTFTAVTDVLNSFLTSLNSLTSDEIENSSTVTGNTVTDALDNLKTSLNHLEGGLAIIVNGDTCSTAVPVGGYAYVKNNTHGLAEGLYANTSASAFPTSGGTANSSVFTAVSDGGLNSLKNSFNSRKLITVYSGPQVLLNTTASIPISNLGSYQTLIFVFQYGANGNYYQQRIYPGLMPWPALVATLVSNVWSDIRFDNSQNKITVSGVGSTSGVYLDCIYGCTEHV